MFTYNYLRYGEKEAVQVKPVKIGLHKLFPGFVEYMVLNI